MQTGVVGNLLKKLSHHQTRSYFPDVQNYLELKETSEKFITNKRELKTYLGINHQIKGANNK